MKIVCVKTDRNINYFFNFCGLICEFWNVDEALDYFRLHKTAVNTKQIIIIDFDAAPQLKGVKSPQNWYIIGLTSDTTIKTDTYSLIHKSSNLINILNSIHEITDESVYRQLGSFHIYIGITKREMDTPQGIVPLLKKQWRILNYFAINKGKRISSQELVYHTFDVGEEDELADPTKSIRVELSRLRKQFSLLINSPVISYGSPSGGYFLLDFFNEDFEYIINNEKNNNFIVIDDTTKQIIIDFYKKVSKKVAEASLYELQHNEKLSTKHRRYTFLKNNLVLKENVSLSKVMLLLKKIRFPSKVRCMKNVTNSNNINERILLS